jgi:mannose-6-phosphate isomerase-like protein (cupin superfamily)
MKTFPILLLAVAACSRSTASPQTMKPSVVAPPVTARFVDLGDAHVAAAGGCDTLYVAIARGAARIGEDDLTEGQVLVVPGPEPLVLQGKGLAVVADYHPDTVCKNAIGGPHRVLGSSGEPLVLSGPGGDGVLRVMLDVQNDPALYLGRLTGTASVPEHVHDKSWEILCAVDAAGTFTLAGVDQRLGPRQVVSVAPGTKHAWKPDPGSTLTAVQIYAPPGPEERFRKMAITR